MSQWSGPGNTGPILTMKKLIALVVVLAGCAFGYDSLTIRCASLTPTNSITVTNAIPVTGKIVSMTFGTVGGSATCRVYTVANRGSTPTTTKAVQGVTVVASIGYVTNLIAAEMTYMAEDRLVVRFDNAAITSTVSDASAVIIYEE